MRKFSSISLVVGIVVGIAILCIPSLSFATSVNLVWTGAATSSGGATLNGNSVALDPSAVATLTLDIQINADSRGVAEAFLIMTWDTDLGNEVNLLSFEELSWSNGMGTRLLDPIDPGIRGSFESSGFDSGYLYEFDGTTLGDGPKNTTLTFARIVFTTNPGRIQTDGSDIFSGANLAQADTFFGCNALNCELEDVHFQGASVNVYSIPEPGTVLMLGLGLGILADVSRRGRN